MPKDKFIPSKKVMSKLEIQDTPCFTCQHYYQIFEARTGIKNDEKEGYVILKQLCYCSINMLGLPFHATQGKGLCPTVRDCISRIPIKETPLSKVN